MNKRYPDFPHPERLQTATLNNLAAISDGRIAWTDIVHSDWPAVAAWTTQLIQYYEARLSKRRQTQLEQLISTKDPKQYEFTASWNADVRIYEKLRTFLANKPNY
jgi:hypothetical protein